MNGQGIYKLIHDETNPPVEIPIIAYAKKRLSTHLRGGQTAADGTSLLAAQVQRHVLSLGQVGAQLKVEKRDVHTAGHGSN